METVLDPRQVFRPAGKGKRIIPREKDSRYEKIPLDDRTSRAFKRTFDITLSLIITLMILSWLIPLLGVIIKSGSRGPVLFLQKRNGLNGRIFTCIKFRTMFINEEADITPCYEGDRRITVTGRILRRYCIDELPQFLNVLSGSMTIVGPRPHMLAENQKYESLIPGYSFRYRAKPGITGLSQVCYRRPENPLQKMRERAFWDLHYIRNWSLVLDMRIVVKTLVFVFYK